MAGKTKPEPETGAATPVENAAATAPATTTPADTESVPPQPGAAHDESSGANPTEAAAAEAAPSQQFTREHLVALGLDPAPYGL